MSKFIASAFGYILNFIYNLVNNYGYAIIIFTLILKGTQEVTWFANSRTAKVITINEEQLDKALVPIVSTLSGIIKFVK